MSKRQLGLALLALGGALVLVGLVLLVTAGDGGTTADTPVTTTGTLPAQPTTSIADATTTTMAPITTTTIGEITTTTEAFDPQATIESFLLDHAAAIEASDVDFLMATLHPAVIEVHGAELCRSFVEREILALVDYRITGEVTGPESQTVASSTFDVYSAPVAFTFSGQDFEAFAGFAVENGELRWMAECR